MAPPTPAEMGLDTYPFLGLAILVHRCNCAGIPPLSRSSPPERLQCGDRLDARYWSANIAMSVING